MYIILAILFFLWLFSYIKFKKQMKYFNVMASSLLIMSKEDSNPQVLLRYASALMMIQHYKDAYEVFDNVVKIQGYPFDLDRIQMNMEFCKSPVPGAKGPKNYNSSWLHNFILRRLGKRRYLFLTEEDHLRTNSIMRHL